MSIKESEQRSEQQSGLIRIEKSISPERVWGEKFKIPSIVGEGSGLGFKIENLHLPINWKEKISELKIINYEHFYNIFKQECEEFELKPGIMKYDSRGILRELTINTNPISKLCLDLNFPKEEEGKYKSENINSPLVGIIMQKTTIKVLNLLLGGKEGVHRGYPYIDGNWEHFGPMNLIVPEKFVKSEKVLYSQEAFKIEASNILGRFGFTLGAVFYNEKNSLLTGFRLKEGNCCCFGLGNGGRFSSHNVDDPYQAVALFGIAAAYINHLLEYETQNE